MDICYKFATFQVYLFTLCGLSSRGWRCQPICNVRISVSTSEILLSRFLVWCRSMLGIKCLVKETSSVTCIAAFKSSGCMCPGEFVFYCGFSNACFTRFCRWFDTTIILWDCTSVPVNVANLLTLSMESYFLFFYAVHFLLLTAETLAVRMDSGTFCRRKRWEVKVLGEMMERAAITSWTVLTLGTWGSKGGDCQGSFLDFEIWYFCIKFLAWKDCFIRFVR